VEEEGISQGLKPAFGAGVDVQAKAWTYHKGNNNGRYKQGQRRYKGKNSGRYKGKNRYKGNNNGRYNARTAADTKARIDTKARTAADTKVRIDTKATTTADTRKRQRQIQKAKQQQITKTKLDFPLFI
jgi:hypothetical protein